MGALLFPDNTVLCNYAAVDRVRLLVELLNGNGRWTQAVHFEATSSARSLPALHELIQGGSMGEPIEVFEADRIERIRRGWFGGSSDRPLEHLGEAETCYLIHNHGDFSGATWITDDHSAYDFGRQQGILTWDTFDTVQQLVGRYTISAQEGFDLLKAMWAAERTPRRMPNRWQDLQ